MILPLLIIIVLSCSNIIHCLILSFVIDGLDIDLARFILKYVHIRIPDRIERVPAVDDELYNLARFLKTLTTHFFLRHQAMDPHYSFRLHSFPPSIHCLCLLMFHLSQEKM